MYDPDTVAEQFLREAISIRYAVSPHLMEKEASLLRNIVSAGVGAAGGAAMTNKDSGNLLRNMSLGAAGGLAGYQGLKHLGRKIKKSPFGRSVGFGDDVAAAPGKTTSAPTAPHTSTPPKPTSPTEAAPDFTPKKKDLRTPADVIHTPDKRFPNHPVATVKRDASTEALARHRATVNKRSADSDKEIEDAIFGIDSSKPRVPPRDSSKQWKKQGTKSPGDISGDPGLTEEQFDRLVKQYPDSFGKMRDALATQNKRRKPKRTPDLERYLRNFLAGGTGLAAGSAGAAALMADR